jgi:hypothetical protein
MKADMHTRDRPSLRPQPARSGDDFWRTPSCLATALVQFVLPEAPGAVWEPAAGDGALAQVMRSAGRDVIATDSAPRANGVARLDFLHDPPPCVGRIAVTNPPFNALDRFVARGLGLLDSGAISGAVLLVRHDALTAASRAGAFSRATTLWICAWRPRWIEGSTGTGRWSNVWVFWNAGEHGPPRMRWVTPAEMHQPRLLL